MRSSFEKVIARMRSRPENVRFADLRNVCTAFFGEARQSGSHVIFKTPWPGDPRINVQQQKGNAKRYQVLQVLAAIDKLMSEEDKP